MNMVKPRKKALPSSRTAPARDSEPKGARRPLLKDGPFGPTAERILEGARQVLIEHGYAALTVRRVADAVGMTVGNLTYHFPSKRRLLRAMIAKLLADYSQRFRTLLANHSDLHGVEGLVRWLFADTITVETVHTFRELWTLALHDQVIRRAVDDFYDEAINGIVQILQRAHPRADVRKTQELVQLLAIISEGMTVLYGTRRSRVTPHERIVELIARLLPAIAPEL